MLPRVRKWPGWYATVWAALLLLVTVWSVAKNLDLYGIELLSKHNPKAFIAKLSSEED